MTVRPIVTVLLLSASLLAAGCGDGGDSGADTTTQSSQQENSTTGSKLAEDGAKVFAENGCGGCHELNAADASGQAGPNLDERRPDVDEAVEMVENGGGGMPPFEGRLSAEEIQAVAVYVSESAGR